MAQYNASERVWVMRLLARLTPAERVEYERRVRAASGHPHTGRKYDGLRAEIAERVMYESRRGTNAEAADG